MRLADRLTLSRIILAPVFFVLYMLPLWFPLHFEGSAIWIVPLLWLIFIIAEFTDMFDGMAARHLNETSDFGKLFDPFADSLLQVTIFLCFVIDGIFPATLFLVVLYREFSILFVRNLMLKKGISMGARMGGKIKTTTYIAAAAVALLYASLRRLSVAEVVQPALWIAALAVFGVSVVFSVLSFLDYITVYRAAEKDPS